MRYVSVCSGIEAATVAWHGLGWEPVAFCEIEPFPSAVLKHHYPDVPNLGDMTRLPNIIRRGELDAPDLLVGGTPCQAFSVAGLRNSLDDNRGQLTISFIGIADAIDDVRLARGEHPCIVVWENVPGVLNTKDNAFGCFLAGLAGESGELQPAGGKWSNAGCVFGPKRAVAWRVLDAQYFGVAQRRRRVFVVASARDGFNPAKVLFEFEGVRRDTAPRRETGQSVAGTIAARFGISRNNHEECVAATLQARMGSGGADADTETLVPVVAGTLDTQCGGGKLTHQSVASGHIVAARMVAFGEYVDDGTASAMKARDYKDATDLVAQPIAIQGTLIGRGDTSGPQGTGADASGAMYTLTKTDVHAVAQPIAFAQNQLGEVRTGEVLNTLNTNSNASGRNTPMVAQPIAIQDCRAVEKAQNGRGWNDDGTAYTVDTHATQGVAQTIAPSLTASNDPSRSPQSSEVTQQVGAVFQAAMQVRRLTPTECERLQGFRDGWTNIPWRGKPESPDGPRYKSLGNSMAVPCMEWIGRRIESFARSE